MLLGKEERLREACAILGHLYPYCGDCSCRIKHTVNTHPDVVDENLPLQLLIYFIGNESNAYMGFYPSFCEMKHRPHFQCAL